MAAVDGLQQSRLLAVEVLGRPFEHGELDAAPEVGGLELVDRGAQAADLGPERALQGEDGGIRTYRTCRDQRALHDLVGVGAQDGPVLEGAGLALGSVYDDHRGLER